MDYTPELKAIGLHQSEIKIYLFLLTNGLASPAQISRGTNIALSNCYPTLTQLKHNGYISSQQNGKRRLYLANDPLTLLNTFDQRKKIVSKIIPDLQALYVQTNNKPEIKFYSGFSEVKQIYLNTLESKEVLSIVSTNHLVRLDPDFFRKYDRTAKTKNIVLRDIVTNQSKLNDILHTKEVLRGLYSEAILPKNYADAPTDICIWGDHIALIVTTEPIFGTVLTSRPIVTMLRTLFDLAWQKLQDN